MISLADIFSAIDSLKRRAADAPLQTAGGVLGGMARSIPVTLADLAEIRMPGANPQLADRTVPPRPDMAAETRDTLDSVLPGQEGDVGVSLGELLGPPGKLMAKLALAAGPLGRIVKAGEKAGQYSGTAGFGGITPQKATALRNQFIADAQQGAPYSKYWYDDASKDLHRIAGSDADAADKLAGTMATLSSGTPVGSNTMYGFKGWNQHAVGDPVKTGKYPNVMGAKVDEILSGEADGTTGLKRDPFQQGLSVEFSDLSPEEKAGLRPVNDIHQASALTGQKVRRGLSPAEHQFLDNQMNSIVPELNKRAQDAIDAARANGVPDDVIATMDQPDWNNYRAQAAAWSTQRVASGAAKTMDEAATHYGHFFNQYAGNITREWTPGMNTGHLPEMINNPQLAQQYADTVEPLFRGKGDVDALAHSMGALTDNVYDNPGVYGAERNPGFVTPIMVGKATGSNDLDPSSKKLMEAVAAAHGLLGTQQQVAGNFLGGTSPAIKMGALLFNRDKPIAGDELKALQDALIAHGMEAAQADPRGARALVFGDQKNAAKAGKTIAGQFGATAEPYAANTFIFPADDNFNAPAQWSAQPFIDKINAAGPKVASGFDAFASQAAPEMLNRVESFAKAQGLTQAGWFRPMMEALSTGGVARLQELVRQGVVPVAAISALGLPMLQDHSGAAAQ